MDYFAFSTGVIPKPRAFTSGARDLARVSTKEPTYDGKELFPADAEHVWQHRFYDFNLWSERKRIEELRYMHRNPVEARSGGGARTLGMEQLSELCLRRSWSAESQ